jgi:uncharacterized protein
MTQFERHSMTSDLTSRFGPVALVTSASDGIGRACAEALAIQGVPGSATYAATKGFVQSFAEGLSVELRPQGISVLSVAPGPVSTGFGTRAVMRMGRAEVPEIVARVVMQALPAGGKVRPGLLSKVLGWSLALLPRWGRVLVLGQ